MSCLPTRLRLKTGDLREIDSKAEVHLSPRWVLDEKTERGFVFERHPLIRQTIWFPDLKDLSSGLLGGHVSHLLSFGFPWFRSCPAENYRYHLPYSLRHLTALLCFELILEWNPYGYKPQQQNHGGLPHSVVAGKVSAHLVTDSPPISLPLSFPLPLPHLLPSCRQTTNFSQQWVLQRKEGCVGQNP